MAASSGMLRPWTSMLRSTSVVITSRLASGLRTMSPVSRPTSLLGGTIPRSVARSSSLRKSRSFWLESALIGVV